MATVIYQMELARKTRKPRAKSVTTDSEDATTKKKRRVRQTIKQRRQKARGRRSMGAGNSRDLTDSLNEVGSDSLKTTTDTINDSSGSQEDGKSPDSTKTCPVCSSLLKCHTSALLQCTRCPTAQFLCASCLYPWAPDSATCTNKLCPLVSTLLTCELVSDPKSKVFGCPKFRACPKCHNLITHAKGCKFVSCPSCRHRFCFICLQEDCSKNTQKYWSLTCTRPRANKQRFILT